MKFELELQETADPNMTVNKNKCDFKDWGSIDIMMAA